MCKHTPTAVGPPEEPESFSHERRGVIPRGFEYLFSHINHETQMVRATGPVTTAPCKHAHTIPYVLMCLCIHTYVLRCVHQCLSPIPPLPVALTPLSLLPSLLSLSMGTSWSTCASVPSWRYITNRCLTCWIPPLPVYFCGRTCIVVFLWMDSRSRVWSQQRMLMT